MNLRTAHALCVYHQMLEKVKVCCQYLAWHLSNALKNFNNTHLNKCSAPFIDGEPRSTGPCSVPCCKYNANATQATYTVTSSKS